MKKILVLSIALIAVIALSAGGTWAYFSDTEIIANNVFTAGTLDLQTNAVNGLVGTWTSASSAPGAFKSANVTLTNNGTVAANHLEMKFNVTHTNVSPDSEILAYVGSYANGTASGAGSTTTLVDTADTALTTLGNAFLTGKVLFIGKGTDAGQARKITSYTPGTSTITVSSAFSSATDGTSNYAIVSPMGTATAAGTTTTLIDTNFLTQGATYPWVGKTLFIVAGTDAGTSSVITTYDNTTHKLTVSPAFTTATDATSQYVITDVDNTDLSTVLQVTALSYDAVDILSTVTTAVGDHAAPLTLSELNGYTYTSTNVPTPSGAASKVFAMTLTFPTTAGNGSQGDSAAFDITLGLMQDASQTLP